MSRGSLKDQPGQQSDLQATVLAGAVLGGAALQNLRGTDERVPPQNESIELQREISYKFNPRLHEMFNL